MPIDVPPPIENFNSIKVRLERPSRTLYAEVLSHFNSIKVRLEQEIERKYIAYLNNFNSIKVRLELIIYYISYYQLVISIP